jgi:hypothetical protein
MLFHFCNGHRGYDNASVTGARLQYELRDSSVSCMTVQKVFLRRSKESVAKILTKCGQIADLGVKRDIVDTLCHASRISATTTTNNAPFLLHEGG